MGGKVQPSSALDRGYTRFAPPEMGPVDWGRLMGQGRLPSPRRSLLMSRAERSLRPIL